MASKQGRGSDRAFFATDGLGWAEASIQGQVPQGAAASLTRTTGTPALDHHCGAQALGGGRGQGTGAGKQATQAWEEIQAWPGVFLGVLDPVNRLAGGQRSLGRHSGPPRHQAALG